jgi:hypothetical protein
MKKSLKTTFVIVLLSIIAISFSVCAQSNSVTSMAVVTIIDPIALHHLTDLKFGNITAGTTTGAVTIVPIANGAAVRKQINVSLPSVAGTTSAASFRVSGTVRQAYSIVMPSSVELALTGEEAVKMVANQFTSNLKNNTGFIGEGAVNDIYIGATLTIAAFQKAGVYVSAPFEVAVAYN